MERGYIYILQLLLLAAITIGSQGLDLNNNHKWALSTARYVMYLLTMHASEVISVLVYEILQKKQDMNTQVFSKVNTNQLMMYVASLALLYFNDLKLYTEDFPFICIAYLIVKYPIVINFSKETISVGAGMAISFVEGYLAYIVPPAANGSSKGFDDKIRIFESVHNIVIPVKKMFIIITKTMNSPPDLKEFNDKSSRDVNRLEACPSFEDVVQDVAGVKQRVYRSAVYRISRGRGPPVHVAAECATPLYTLYKAIKNKHVYDQLNNVKVEEVVSDFMSTLRMTLAKCPQLADKCELVYFDDTDDNLNLADILLDRIKELEPDFEKLISRSD